MGHDTFDIKQYARTARAVVAEGTVMLRNASRYRKSHLPCRHFCLDGI